MLIKNKKKAAYETTEEKIIFALQELKNSNSSFKEVTVFNEYIKESMDVYLFEDGDKQVAVSWNERKVKVSEITVANKSGASVIQAEFEGAILKVLILLDFHKKLIFGLEEDAETILAGCEDYASRMNKAINEGIFRIAHIPTEQNFFIENIRNEFFEEFLEEEEVVVVIEVEEEAELPNDKEKEMPNEVIEVQQTPTVKEEDDAVWQLKFDLSKFDVASGDKKLPVKHPVVKTNEVEQLTFDELFEDALLKNNFEEKVRGMLEKAIDETLVNWQEEIEKVKANRFAKDFDFLITLTEKAAKKQKFEKVENELTLEKVKEANPWIFDDHMAEQKFVELKLDYDFIQLLMQLRRYMRERLLKEEDYFGMSMISNKAVFKGSKDAVSIGLAAMLTGENTLLSGVASAGKSTAVETFSCLCNYPLVRISGNADTTIESLIGTKVIKNGEIEVVDAPMITATKKGYLFFFDELSSVDAQVATTMNPLFDDQGVITNEMNGEIINRHPDTRYIAAINDHSLGYAGTQELNPATKSRFVVASVQYVGEEVLTDILTHSKPARNDFQRDVLNMNDHKKSSIRLTLEIAERLKTIYDAGEVSEEALAIRSYKSFLNLSKVLSPEQAIKAIIDKTVDEGEKAAILGALSSIPALKIDASSILNY